MIRPSLVALLFLVVAAGCGYGDDDEEDQPQAPPAAAAPRMPEAEADGGIAVEGFNNYLETTRPAFASSSLRTAIEFTNTGEGQASVTTVVAEEGPEGGGDDASVTLTREGLADDSVRAVRYVVELERGDEGTWRLRSAQRLQRCQPERGHQDFSPQLCT